MIASPRDLPVGPLGAHTSAGGGAWRALLEGASIGATTVQLFTANQRRWHAAPLAPEAIEQFRNTLQDTGLTQVMSHASYLLNLGSPDELSLARSRQALEEEIARCLALGVSYLNFHPGAALEETREACLERIVASMLHAAPLLEQGKLRLLLETTAGQGSVVGAWFEELAYIIERTAYIVPVGVCMDTCHIFARGYDIRTAAGWEATLAKFDTTVGLQHLFAFHLNDSVHPLGSRKDRHAALGQGEIGLASFQYLMGAPATRHLPKYLETPGGVKQWEKEIALLKELAAKSERDPPAA